GNYRSIWRYFDLSDAINLLPGVLPPTVLMLVLRVGWAHSEWGALPLTCVLMDYVVCVVFMLTARSARRMFSEAARPSGKRKRTLLVGTDEGLASALRQIKLSPDVWVVGLLAPDARLQGSQIAGFRVLDRPKALAQHLATGRIDLVLIVDDDADSIANCVSAAMDFGVEVRLLPSAANIIRGDVKVAAIPKPELALNQRVSTGDSHPLVIDCFRNRSVLITGAGGSIGSELSRQVARLPVSRVLLLDQDENSIFEIHGELSSHRKSNIVPLVADIRDRERICTVFGKYRPQVVLHAAAYKHVPVMETNCTEAILNNVTGTRMLAEAAIEFGAERFLMISTDKAVNPSSIMGATKRMAELLVQNLAARQDGNDRITRCACVRFGNVMGSRGSVVPLFLRQIADGGPLTITDADMTRYFMTIPEAVQLVLQAATLGSNGDIYMLDMGDPIKITTLARRLIEMSGLRPGQDIEIRFVGKRPGEKLHEQLWYDTSKVVATSFPHVLSMRSQASLENFESHLDALELAALSHNDELARQTIKEMPINYSEHNAAAAVSA
ncbi:MAG: nucleoside-diphosphate sugar epimerase/dehydratase, partial [Terriglobales bacterium]